MSKRPKAAGSFLSRLRRPASRLRDMPIWSKLGLIMIVPTIATVVVGTTGLVDHLQTLNNANRAGDLANLIGYSDDLIDSLQDERTSAVLFVSSTEVQTKAQYQEAYNRANSRVDQAKAPYLQQRLEIDGLPANFNSLLDNIDGGLTGLPGTRSQVSNGKLKLTEALRSYSGLIAELLSVRDSATQLAGDNDLSDRMRAATAVARQKEYLSQRRVVIHQVLVQKKREYTPNLREQFIASTVGDSQALESFKAVANPADSEFYDQTVSGSDLRESIAYQRFISSNTSGSLADAQFGPDQWDAAMVENAKLLRTVEQRLDSNVVREADKLRSDVQRQVFLETGLLLSMLLLAILFAYLVARSMARSLRDLRQGALSVAQYGLPQAVARLRDPQVTGQLSPVQLANQIAEPLPVRSKDEFGQVTEAFNAVHLEAVRTAAEQAALRASVATMFVNLARRSQILVDRLIGHLDRLERGEEDPDRLAELFQLDHLATRMRRNDENLLVLAGADSTRVQREPAALIDVLRAAQSEVEHYTRIEFGVIDRDIEVAAHAVNDLVHLVAELFDNATAFSPPDSQVMVEARRVGDRASLYVEDRGIGISAEQLRDLNERLATPPQVDVAVSRMMGLVVVARLASRHGVKVDLRPGADRGTVADVTLPTSVLVPRALSGRGQQPPALPAATGPAPAFGGPQQVGPAPAFGALAALGNGPATPPAPRPGESGNQVTLGGRPFDPATTGGGRSMPAWSDLTGASGINGSDSFTPRTSNGQPIDPLPQRRNGGDGDPSGTGQQPAIPRQLPSSPETRPYNPPPVSAPPLPPTSGVPVSASPVSGHPVSGQPVSSQPYSGHPVSAAPAPGQPYSAPPAQGQPYSAPPAQGQPYSAPSAGQLPPQAPPATAPSAAAPPAWPPVAAPDRDAATPPVPERLAAALDMTTELPRVPRPEAAPPAAMPPAVNRPPAANRPTTPQQSANRQRYADETMELPIFRELESAWFRTRRPGPEEAGTAPAAPANGAATQQFAKVDAAGRAVQQTPPGTTGNAPMAHTPTAGGAPRDNGTATNGGARPAPAEALPNRRPQQQPPAGGWQTAADDGWRAASAATEVPVAETTQKGLPKRKPMAQLVPGGVEKPSASVQRRTPEGVRGLLSAYHRGVQRGRNNPTDSNSTGPEATPGGQQSSQSGSGPVAGSGQKEQQG
ncbi:nitrate- and nitrite sensing domain-containing protein [Micromonospora sp. 4G57]|uniref:histidine kinase n=1 Tax=Micromonospora sicca TaxID=2202420 RepID=A0ABU5J9I2_9ACTN|nr:MULTISPECIES: nitrate- and nitrite sensing domain-containing protein [unclassified Micromonospora]MDZ5441904.1 nitrate- and nitrite sensing domain-containing protein [Micromonospora sp. 4G57]MDZ5489243.1 nitrate- and nitrite sensing domain-containing protein [Micromonospora sp. 4G53]